MAPSYNLNQCWLIISEVLYDGNSIGNVRDQWGYGLSHGDHSEYGLSQWEKALHNNASSYWLSPYLAWSLCQMPQLKVEPRLPLANDLKRKIMFSFNLYFQHTLRGVHISPYCKLMTCAYGSMYDIIVDVRPDSPTYLMWLAVKLDSRKRNQLMVPAHCGHAYYAMEDDTITIYCQVSGHIT